MNEHDDTDCSECGAPHGERHDPKCPDDADNAERPANE